MCSLNSLTTDPGRYYILTLLREMEGGKLEIARKIWYDRADLRVSRVQLFGAGGKLDSDIVYSDWQPAGTTSRRRERARSGSRPVTRAISRSGVRRTITSSKSAS